MPPQKPELKPLGWIASLFIFVGNAALLRVALYWLAPAYHEATGKPYLVGYLICWIGAMALVFLASLAAYKLEGRPFTRTDFIFRYRLQKLNRGDWAWLLIMLVGSLAFLAGLSFSMDWLRSIPLFSPHPGFPPDLADMANNLTPGILFGMPLKGQWWLVITYVTGWLFNVVGEEFWYRGWMLPRQEAAFGKYAWIINGLMFNFQHTFQPWNLLAMLPGSLLVSYAVQRRGKTWLSMLWHGLLNVNLLFFIIQGVIAG
jgi:membrane protease YdiL (CAAX protease family)